MMAAAANGALKWVTLLIADRNKTLLKGLMGNNWNENEGEPHKLLIDNKYYKATVDVYTADDIRSATAWYEGQTNVKIGAVICKYEGDSNLLIDLKNAFDHWKPHMKVLVCDRLERDATWESKMQDFFFDEGCELVELDPDEETLKDMQECADLRGINRIRQVLEMTKGERIRLKENPHKDSPKVSYADDDSEVTETGRKEIARIIAGQRQSLNEVYKDVPHSDKNVLEFMRKNMANPNAMSGRPMQTTGEANKQEGRNGCEREDWDDEFGELVSVRTTRSSVSTDYLSDVSQNPNHYAVESSDSTERMESIRSEDGSEKFLKIRKTLVESEQNSKTTPTVENASGGNQNEGRNASGGNQNEGRNASGGNQNEGRNASGGNQNEGRNASGGNQNEGRNASGGNQNEGIINTEGAQDPMEASSERAMTTLDIFVVESHEGEHEETIGEMANHIQEARDELAQFAVDEDRQNRAADVMLELMVSLNVEDLTSLSSSSGDEGANQS